MYRSNQSRLVPIILIAIAVIVVVIILVVIGRSLFGAGSGSNAGNGANERTNESGLLTLEADRSVEMFVRGPIVADENFQSYSIVVSPSDRVYRTYVGYGDTVVSKKSYVNTMKAYEQFVYALDKANFTLPGKQSGSENSSDTRGICATGRVFEFMLKKGNDNTYQSWTSACSGSPGTFGADRAQVSSLFTSQIPGLSSGNLSQLSLGSL